MARRDGARQSPRPRLRPGPGVRFVGRDAFGGLALAPQTANRYTFGTGNPLLAVDPSGHFNTHLVMHVRAFVSLGVSVAGPVGVGYTFLAGVIGHDPIAGVGLSTEERVLAVAPVVGVGAIAAIGPKLGRAVPRALTFVDDLDLGARAGALSRTAGGGGRSGDPSRLHLRVRKGDGHAVDADDESVAQWVGKPHRQLDG